MVIKSAESRRSVGGVASSRIGKPERKQVVKKSLSFESPASEDLRDQSPVSEVLDGFYYPDSAKKCLSSEFGPGLKDNLDLSVVTEVSSGSHIAESLVVDSPATATPDVFSLVEFSPTSEITTDINEDLDNISAKYTQCGNSAYSSVEVDVVVEHLRYALLLIERSTGIQNPSKKLVETLIKTVIEQFYGIPEESDLLSRIVKAKTCIVATCLVLWMICTLVAVYVKCHAIEPSYGPLPT